LCCTDRIAKLPDYWEYSSGKWVAFKKNIELEWRYGEQKVDNFRIDRVKVKLTNDDIKEIIKLIRKNNIEGLIAKDGSLRKKINFQEKIEIHKPSEEMDYKDKEKPAPAFGEYYLYQVTAIKNRSISLPDRLSVILLDRSK